MQCPYCSIAFHPQLPKEELQSAAIDEKDILVMPFTLSRLSKMVIQQ